MRPVIALLSDFGTRDHYAGTMKGVILGICPEATLVDITHDVAAHDVLDGALQLASSYRYFPAGTVFLAVVDPGVGSARRGLAAEAGDYRFVAPDNGVLTEVLRETPPRRVVELSERRYARPTVTRTFEGRDRFAPAAAWLAKGTQLSALGRTLTDFHRLDIPVPEAHGDGAPRRRPDRRSVREPRHQHRPQDVRGLRQARRVQDSGRRRVRWPAGLDLRRDSTRGSVRTLRQFGPPRTRGQRRERRRASWSLAIRGRGDTERLGSGPGLREEHTAHSATECSCLSPEPRA